MYRTLVPSGIMNVCRQPIFGLQANSWTSFQIRNLRKSPVKIKTLPVPKSEKRLDVVILGIPNVGKSVLLNSLLKTKLVATSRKRHTTRREILGVFNHRNTQLAFYDTPGYTRKEDAKKDDVKDLRDITVESVEKADVVLLVCDATKCNTKYHDAIAEMAKIALDNAKLEVILVINKVDLIEPKNILLSLTRRFVGLVNYAKFGASGANKAHLDLTTFMVSAQHNDGILDLKNYLLSIAQKKPWLMKSDMGNTDLTNEERIEEIVLEMMLEHVHEEVPYTARIRTRSIKSLTDLKLAVDVDIYLESPNQARIVVGQFGRTITKIRVCAVAELEHIFGKEVLLQLWINDSIPKDVEEEEDYR